MGLGTRNSELTTEPLASDPLAAERAAALELRRAQQRRWRRDVILRSVEALVGLAILTVVAGWIYRPLAGVVLGSALLADALWGMRR